MASQLSLTGFVCKNLLHRRLRTLPTLCGIGMAIGAFVGLVGFSNAFEHAWLQLHSSSDTDIAVIQQALLNTSVDESAGKKLEALPGWSRRRSSLSCPWMMRSASAGVVATNRKHCFHVILAAADSSGIRHCDPGSVSRLCSSRLARHAPFCCGGVAA
jgi:hypothetical protein